MEQLSLTRKQLEEQFNEISEQLEMVGLSRYEARAYIALIAHGYGDAETIANTAQIPRTSSYKILKSLQDKGFVIATHGRPTIFKPEAPDKIYQQFESKLKETFDKLGLLHEIVRERGMPQLIFTIAGKGRVLEKIGELLDKASISFMISTPLFNEINDNLYKKLENADKRGVEITVITAPGQSIPENAKVIRRKGLIATDVISDNKEALLASPDLNACGYTDNVLLAEHMQKFLEIMVEYSK
ncbi:MAG: TrmB family transcriptional regulator [Thermoplasmata archaeon]|nr:MAG: TrmB family transcriptional regulator [Thermoplasmata archaeon]